MKEPRILFLAQKPLGDACFEVLNKSKLGAGVKAIASNKTKDNWWRSSHLYDYCCEKNVKFIDNSVRNEDELLRVIKDFEINTLISVQHSWVLSGEILKAVDYFAFNLHNAKIPDYKGYNTYNHAILNGERDYYSTIHWIIDEVDMGEIAFEKSVAIDENTTAKSLIENANQTAIEVFENLIRTLEEGRLPMKKKIAGKGKFYSRNSLEKFREIIDVNDFDEVDRKSRAFYNPPFESAYFKLNGIKFHVEKETV